MTIRVTTKSPVETQAFARLLGSKLRGGEIINLVGDLGAGKTTFVVGLAEGLGSKDSVSSPTFTIYNTYLGRLTLYHGDFYRLRDDALIDRELDDLQDGKAVLVLEWAENIPKLKSLPAITVNIAVIDENTRSFEMAIPQGYNYLDQ